MTTARRMAAGRVAEYLRSAVLGAMMDHAQRIRQPIYRVLVRRCPHGDDSVWVRVTKAWWGGPVEGSKGRELHSFCVPRPDGGEAEMIARGLEAAAAAIRG